MLTVIVAAGAFFLGFCLGAGTVVRQVRSGRVVAGRRVYRCMDTGPVVR